MKVLVIGSGGREHALVWKASQSKRVKKIFAIPGNSGMRDLAEVVEIDLLNPIEIANFAEKEGIDLTIVGPENILSLGVVDEFTKRNLKIFGPSQKAAFLETSKSFAKEFMKKHNIPTGTFKVFDAASDAIDYLKDATYPIVIKADGLAAGKGVFIIQNYKDSVDVVKSVMMEKQFGTAGDKIVIEEFLVGKEMSFMALCDGKRALPLVTSMDYKKAGNNDEGPNTGGMGAISPSPQVNSELFDVVMKTIINPTLEGMRYEGREFKGLLYAGLIIDNNKPKVLEFNVRFGDPETQPIMMRLNSDIIDILEGVVEGNISDITVSWDEQVSGSVVLTSGGYPEKYDTGKVIEGLKRAKAQGVEIFHAGTKWVDNEHQTSGGRVLNICSKDHTLKDAMTKIYDAINFIKFENMNFRNDIGRIKE